MSNLEFLHPVGEQMNGDRQVMSNQQIRIVLGELGQEQGQQSLLVARGQHQLRPAVLRQVGLQIKWQRTARGFRYY